MTFYQHILLTLQVGVGIQCLSSNNQGTFWILALISVFLCFLIGPPYEYRVNNANYWRAEILTLIKERPKVKLTVSYSWVPLYSFINFEFEEYDILR